MGQKISKACIREHPGSTPLEKTGLQDRHLRSFPNQLGGLFRYFDPSPAVLLTVTVDFFKGLSQPRLPKADSRELRVFYDKAKRLRPWGMKKTTCNIDCRGWQGAFFTGFPILTLYTSHVSDYFTVLSEPGIPILKGPLQVVHWKPQRSNKSSKHLLRRFLEAFGLGRENLPQSVVSSLTW